VPSCEQSYPCRSLTARIPVLRETWKETETSPKSEGFQFGIEDIFRVLGRYFHVVEQHTTVFAMMLDELLLKVLHNFANCETKSGERNFLRSSASRPNNIYVFPRFSEL